MNVTRRITALLVLIQAVSTLFLWTLSATVSAGRFAVFLAVDMLSFVMISYFYTHQNWGELVSRGWILAGSVALVVLLLSSIFFQ